MSRGKTIQIYLTDGEPTGIRTAELTTSISRAVIVPRKRVGEADKRGELRQPGLYFLFGFDDEPRVYIGKSIDCMMRLKQHNGDPKKDFWNLAVAFITKDNSFTPTHLDFLENMAITQAKGANRFSVHNAVLPVKFPISNSMKDECADHFDAMTLLLGTLGFPVFKAVNDAVNDDSTLNQTFVIDRRGANAKGRMTDEGFVILAGSIAPVDVTSSFPDAKKAYRQKLIDKGVIEVRGDQLVFLENVLMGTPSGTSTLVLGASSNGWIEWKTQDGKTLDAATKEAKASE